MSADSPKIRACERGMSEAENGSVGRQSGERERSVDLQFFSEYPATGGHLLLLEPKEWERSVEREDWSGGRES